jgi:hypothetical protein
MGKNLRAAFVLSGLIAVAGLLPVVGIPFQIVTLTTGLIKLREGDKRAAIGFFVFGLLGALLTAIFFVFPFDGSTPHTHRSLF